ncbi:hypothetical protein SUGI_1096290 [Cryptomeria japonica]|nr:hypothetical protein SUGI_1096290 [Cryptomeria japonica]
MLLRFISLLLTVGQTKNSQICISESLGDSLLPCPKEESSEVEETEKFSLPVHHRKLMFLAPEISLRRSLATYDIQSGHCDDKGKVPLISQD